MSLELSISKEANINYLAKIVKLEEHNFSQHPNADKLQLVHLYGNTISTSIDDKPGYYVYFPVECVICPEFLKFHNLYKNSNFNTNPEEKGFFEDSGRVKCIKLRGIASEGFLIPYEKLVSFINFFANNEESSENVDSLVNESFDTVNNIKLVWKYTISVKNTGVNRNSSNSKSSKVSSKIIENQFRYHINTPKLQDNIYKLNPNDLIQISIKEHGTSAIFCNLLTKKELTWKEKIAKKLGVPIIESEYTTFCSSRKVIKDPLINPNLQQSYYDCDIWNLGLEVVKDYLQSGMTLYAEIVEYMPTGSSI